jgi:DegV family protein with EDD domain
VIKIIADSGCDFTSEMLEKKVARVPLTLQLGDNIYEDSDSLNIDAYLKLLRDTPKGRKTAAPSPEKFLEEYKDGDEIFVVTLSRHISGSYASAVTAKNMYLEDIGDKFIHIIDSKSASAGEVIIINELFRLIDKGLSAEEIKPLIEDFVADSHTYFTFENFDTIVDAGRMNGYVAKLASMLNIMPICAGVDGKMELLTQARGRKKAYAKIAELIAETGIDTASRTLVITHVAYEDEAQKLEAYLKEKFNFRDSVIAPPTGLVCTYADYHGLIVAF